MKRFFLPLFFCLLLLQISLHASEAIDLTINNRHIGEHLSIYEDTTAAMGLSEVTQLPENAFTSLGKKVDSHLFTSSAYWYRFDASNPQNQPLSRLIVFGIPWLDIINIHIIGPHGTTTHIVGGDTYPYAIRTYNSNLSNFEHQFEPGKSTVYIQVKTRDPFIVPISILDHVAFLEQIAYQTAFIAFIYGILGAMILYNLFLLVCIKTRYYAFYILYIFLFIVMNASYKGYTFEWLFYDNPTIQNWAESTNIYLFTISGLLFLQSFLNFKNDFPRLFLWTNGIIISILTIMITFFFIGYHFHVILAIASVMFYSLYAFSIGIYALIKGYRFALFFLLGTSAGLVGSTLTSLTVMAAIPYKDVLFHAVDYGMVIDAILLSLALADKVKSVQKEKMAAVTEANTDALTGLLNRRAYKMTTDAELNRIKRSHGNLSLILMDIDYFKNVNDTYGHSGGDAVLKAVASLLIKSVRSYDYIFRFGGEEFVLLLPQTDIHMALSHAHRISSEIETLIIPFQGNPIQITVSMGISEYKEEDTSIECVFNRADNRLYQAKTKGRNQIVGRD